MLGIGHMVCAENARAGVTLKRQKICRKWVGLQVQRDLDVVPAHSSLPPGEGKRYGTWQRTATQSTASLATPPTPSHALWHFWPWSPPFPQFLAPLPAPPPAGSAPHPLTQALTARLRTVSPQVRKLHRRAGRGCSGGKERETEQLSGSPPGSEPRAPLLGGGLPVPPRPFLSPAQPGLPEPQHLPGRSSHSSPGASGRADVIAQGGHDQLSLPGGGGASRRADPRPTGLPPPGRELDSWSWTF